MSPTTRREAPLRKDPTRVRSVADLGALIRSHRKESKTTLVDAAGFAGVGVSYLLELEHGKPTASLGKALQVLERFGLEVWVSKR